MRDTESTDPAVLKDHLEFMDSLDDPMEFIGK